MEPQSRISSIIVANDLTEGSMHLYKVDDEPFFKIGLVCFALLFLFVCLSGFNLQNSKHRQAKLSKSNFTLISPT